MYETVIAYPCFLTSYTYCIRDINEISLNYKELNNNSYKYNISKSIEPNTPSKHNHSQSYTTSSIREKNAKPTQSNTKKRITIR